MPEGIRMPHEEKIDGIDAWKVRNAAETLVEAKKIQAKPKLLAAATKEIDKNMVAEAQAKLDAVKAASKSPDPSKQPTVTIIA